MNKSIKTVALLTVLSVAAVGCQKETIIATLNRPQFEIKTSPNLELNRLRIRAKIKALQTNCNAFLIAV